MEEEEAVHDPTHFFQGDVHDDAMTTDQALVHLLDDYIIAHGSSSHSTAFRRLFFYFPEVEEVFVDYFHVISETYLHLCYHSERDVQHKESNRTESGVSADGFVDMLVSSGVYARTNTKMKRLYLMISQSKQAWDWKIPPANSTNTKGKTIDDMVVQYERISFAEYVELLGRIALQLAHERMTATKRIRRSGGGGNEGSGGEKKQANTTKVTSSTGGLHASLDMDRNLFLEQLPTLLQKLKKYILKVNDELQARNNTNLNRLLQKSTAAARASRRTSVVNVMKTVKLRLEERHNDDVKVVKNV